MQYHLNGFRPGDPDVAPAVADAGPADTADVVVVGCGPAGLTLATQLSAFADIRTRIVERKDGPLRMGQADGIACRSMEMFQAFGFAHRVAREAYWVNETVFWRPGPGGIVRGERIRDVEEDLSEMPHVILSQARVHDFYLETMAKGPRRLIPDYGLTVTGVTRTDDPVHPVTVALDGPGGARTLRAKYVVGCDGARSAVRRSLGYDLRGEAARQLWGVWDVLAVTDFPDIRLKCAIQSAEHGSLLVIPREGGAMVRLYIELGKLAPGERAADRAVTPAMLDARARAILAPYTLEVRQVAWWSAYEIGQRICDRFDDATPARDPRIFIAGDACHTHSPKAGQGMNVSMADAFNLGWKLAAVLRGQSDADLLRSYSVERQAKAQELIDFDRDLAQVFSRRTDDGTFAEAFQDYFQRHGRYTAGVATRYAPSAIVMEGAHQDLAAGLAVGMRFHSAPVIRLADARPMQLGHALLADGRWRVILFAAEGDDGTGPLARNCAALAEVVARRTPAGRDPDAVIDVRAVLQVGHREVAPTAMPPLLRPAKGPLGLVDYEKVFCPDPAAPIHAMRGIAPAGAMILVRPDQVVAGVLPLADVAAADRFFAGLLKAAPAMARAPAAE